MAQGNNVTHITPAKASSVRQTVHFGDVIRAHRKAKKISQQDLAMMLGVSRNNVANWESDKYKPEFDLIPAVCRILDVSIDELFGVETTTSVSTKERKLIYNYRLLSDVGKNVISAMTKKMYEEECLAQDAMFKEQYMMIDNYQQSLAAGTGCDVTDLPVEYRFVRKNNINAKADAIFRVSGDSMLPLYHSGEYVYVQKMDYVDPGFDAVFMTADGYVIKRVGENGYPTSLNRALPFYTDEPGRIKTLGRVVGIAASSDFPNRNDESLLHELFEDEIHQFERVHPATDR